MPVFVSNRAAFQHTLHNNSGLERNTSNWQPTPQPRATDGGLTLSIRFEQPSSIRLGSWILAFTNSTQRSPKFVTMCIYLEYRYAICICGSRRAGGQMLRVAMLVVADAALHKLIAAIPWCLGIHARSLRYVGRACIKLAAMTVPRTSQIQLLQLENYTHRRVVQIYTSRSNWRCGVHQQGWQMPGKKAA